MKSTITYLIFQILWKDFIKKACWVTWPMMLKPIWEYLLVQFFIVQQNIICEGWTMKDKFITMYFLIKPLWIQLLFWCTFKTSLQLQRDRIHNGNFHEQHTICYVVYKRSFIITSSPFSQISSLAYLCGWPSPYFP